MIDSIKDYLAPKRFGVVSYACLLIHFLCGLILTALTNEVRKGEFGKFSCAVDTKSTPYKTYVEKTCYSRYEQTYNSPLPLYGFVLLSFGLQVFVSVIYSLAVSSRVDEIADRTENGSEETRTNEEETSHGCNVFYFYFFHLVVRSVFGIVFTVLQHTVFYPSGFDFEFSCSLATTEVTSLMAKNSSVTQFNITSIICENSTALEKELWGIIVSISNTVFALIMLGEVIYLWRRFPMLNHRSDVARNRGTEFVTVYLLRKRYMPVAFVLTNTECIEFYKQQVLQQSLSPDVYYVSKTSLDDMYIDVVIHTGRAQHQFLKRMDRHEIYDVYTRVPMHSIRLKKIEDLFYPNEDTKGKSPRTILAVGRPGIGKTVLTEKIIRDWANPDNSNDLYHGKIAFFFKFRWLDLEGLKDMSLKTFLRHGAGGLDEEKFEIVFEQILRQSEKAIFIFDGLDEFTGDFMKSLDESRILSNDANSCMSPMTLFIKLVSGNMLRGATNLVTSRPTADAFYSKLHFDRIVEMIGFTTDKIEDYVGKFCKNNNRSDLKSKIWNHIKSSSDLLNLCYIPVNCYIVCVTLSGSFTSSSNDTGALPTTTTSLYQTAIDHFGKCHNRNLGNMSSEQMLETLQKLAFDGMKKGQLIFNEKYFDAQMRKSGLVNSLTNPVSPLQTQFCFIHLTIQEFLAAKHVIQTLTPDEIEKFISTHIKSGKWHLILQFIAGLLGEKIKMFGSDYQDCVLAFAKSLILHDGVIDLDDSGHVFVMKCLREVDDVEIVKIICETSDLSNAQKLESFGMLSISSSELAAVAFVCKLLNNLIHLHLQPKSPFTSEDFHSLVCELLKQKCVESLKFRKLPDDEMNCLIGAMTNSKCALNHEHAKLRRLKILGNLQDDDVSEMSKLFTFIKDGHASNLQVLGLPANNITSHEIFELSEVLNGELCGELTYLDVSYNPIGDEGVGILCNALIQGHCKINKLVLNGCFLTAECVRWLSEVLCDVHCKLTELSLFLSLISDEAVRMLCTKALGKDQCKLTKLDLGGCFLTTECVRSLSEVLCDKHCKLTDLSLDRNAMADVFAIGDEGVRMLCAEALGKEQCKLTRLDLGNCSLTTDCVRWLSEVLSNEHCKLTDLALFENDIGDKGVRMLCTEALGKEQCKLTRLDLRECSLTTDCVRWLSEVLCVEHCKLTDLSLDHNAIGVEGVRMLSTNALRREQCKLATLSLSECKLTDQCVTPLCETLRDGNCRLIHLSIRFNDLTEQGKGLLREVQKVEICKARGLKISFESKKIKMLYSSVGNKIRGTITSGKN